MVVIAAEHCMSKAIEFYTKMIEILYLYLYLSANAHCG